MLRLVRYIIIMTKKEKRQLRKSLANKWEKLIEALGQAGGKTLAYYDAGEDMQQAAIVEIERMKNQPLDLGRLRDSLPSDVIKKVSWHDLKRIADNYNKSNVKMNRQP